MTIQTMRDFGIGEGQIFIGGAGSIRQPRPARDRKPARTRASSTLVPSSTIEDADRAVAAARKAQPAWAR